MKPLAEGSSEQKVQQSFERKYVHVVYCWHIDIE